MNLLSSIPPEVWYAVAGIVLTLIVSAGHARGYKLPLLEGLLNWIHTAPAPSAPNAAIPAGPTIGDGHLLRELLELLQKQKPAPPAS